MKIVLASKSPRRQELLQIMGLSDFIIDPATSEEQVQANLSPSETVMAIAAQKAAEVAKKHDANTLVIAADTLVYLGNAQLGKPRNENEAAHMLRALSGKSHKVFTGVSLILGNRSISDFEETTVFFRPLSETEIRSYVSSGEPMDKAGAYGVQGLGSIFVERINGDFFNVMGLPICRLYTMLCKLGISILG